MTHEEAAVQLVRDYAKSYNSYPFMIYQIQTKFRDEARPRAGLIRVREFTMKDAYSFHTSQKTQSVIIKFVMMLITAFLHVPVSRRQLPLPPTPV